MIFTAEGDKYLEALSDWRPAHVLIGHKGYPEGLSGGIVQLTEAPPD